MTILANHAHLIPPPRTGDWWPEGGVDTLLRHLDACQVDMAVVFPPFACQVENDMWQANRWALDEIRPHRKPRTETWPSSVPWISQSKTGIQSWEVTWPAC